MWLIPLVRCPRGINHTTTSSRPINGTEEKCLCCSSILSFVFQRSMPFSTLVLTLLSSQGALLSPAVMCKRALESRLHSMLALVGFTSFSAFQLRQFFKVAFRISCSSCSQWMLGMLSDSESELLVIQILAAAQLSFRKATLNLYLRVQTTRKQLTISIYAPRIFWRTFLHMKKIPAKGSLLSLTRKFRRGMKPEYHKALEGQLHGVH